MEQSLVFTASNPLADAPVPQRMDLEFGEAEVDKRSPMEQLMAASCMSEQQITALGDEDLLALMMDHNLGISAKNEVLTLVEAARNGLPRTESVQREDGPPGGEQGELLARRMEEHRKAQEWLEHPRDTQLRCVAFAVMVLLMCTIYQHGAQHFTAATAATDLHLFRWAQEHGGIRTLNLHGPTTFEHTTISKTWANLPAHHGLHLDFRLWAVGQCGACEGNPPEALVQIDNAEYRDNGSGKSLKRRTNYYVNGDDADLDAEKENSAFSWEFSVHADRLPAPGPQTHSAAFAEVSFNQRHTADSVTLEITQDWHDGQDYVDMIHGVGTQQLLLDAVQLSVSTCAAPPQQPALPAPVRRSMADQTADRVLAAAALAAAVANITFMPGQGVGRTDEFMGQADSPIDCANLVASHRPSANGVSYSAPDTRMRGCWAEYGMVDREIGSGSLKFVSAYFGDLNDGGTVPAKWVASATQQAHICTATISECDGRLRQASETRPVRPGDMRECQAAAEAAGLSLGGGGLDFAGDYPAGGCYTYSSGVYFGMAFWSTGNNPLDEQQRPLFLSGAGIYANDCQTCSELGWAPSPTGSESVCAESDAGFECHNEIMFDEAEELCLSLGARLCTAAEIVNLVGSGTGCGHDARRVWTSSTSEGSTGVTCTDTERIAVRGRFNGEDKDEDIGCVDMQSTRSLPALRCCADPTCSDPCDPSHVEGPQTWRQLFRQTAGNFRRPNDWIRYNSDDTRGDFSILDELEDCRQDDGNFHLKLVWPGLVLPAREDIPASQEWKQQTNPVTSNSDVVIGYSAVDVNFPFGASGNGQESGGTAGWHGLRHSAGENDSLLQADNDNQARDSAIPWFAVGTSHAYRLNDDDPSASSLPGPRISELDSGRRPGVTVEGVMAQVVELYAVCPSQDVDEQQHMPRCCSDSMLPGFVRDESASPNCPFVQTEYGDHECEHMSWSAAHRVCAVKGARLCTLEEIAHGCTSAAGCARDDELVWTVDGCDDVGAEIECSEEACQQVNAPCDALDVHADDLVKTVVADETTQFTMRGWHNHPLTYNDDDRSASFELCDRSGCRTCTDEVCNSEQGACMGTGNERICLNGLVPVDVAGTDQAYTCCEEETRGFEIGTGQGSTDIDPNECSTHADCAIGHYCDSTEHCWECASLSTDWCDSFDGPGLCCSAEILAHCNLDDWPDLKELCDTQPDSIYALRTAYSLDYLYDSDDWRPESLSTPVVLQIFGYHYWLYLWVIVSTWGFSYVILCRKAPEKACTPLPVYPYVGRPIGVGEYFRITGGFDDRRLDSTPSRLVLRGNSATCSCLPGRCGGFRLQEQHQVFPTALRERGVAIETWQEYMHRLDRIQRQYGHLCDYGSRLSCSGACCLHFPWYLTPVCPMSWASNCYCCCGCCWRCCCCCECWQCCCCTCECCCPGAAGFLGLAWHIFSYLILPFIPWSRCDPFQVAMHKWLEDFNVELQPVGVRVKAFTFAQTDRDGNRHADDNVALSVLAFSLDHQEEQVLEMEPVLQAGHHPDQNCGVSLCCGCPQQAVSLCCVMQGVPYRSMLALSNSDAGAAVVAMDEASEKCGPDCCTRSVL